MFLSYKSLFLRNEYVSNWSKIHLSTNLSLCNFYIFFKSSKRYFERNYSRTLIEWSSSYLLRSNWSTFNIFRNAWNKRSLWFSLRFFKITHVPSSVIQTILSMIPCFNPNPKKIVWKMKKNTACFINPESGYRSWL